MFGFLIGGLVNDDAVKLKSFTDMVLNKYRHLSFPDLCTAIARDFDKEDCYIDRSQVRFGFRELEEFDFSVDGFMKDAGLSTLTVVGRGKYAGFMMQVSGGDTWHCSVEDGIAYRATGGARKLVHTMEKKFGIEDLAKLMRGYR